MTFSQAVTLLGNQRINRKNPRVSLSALIPGVSLTVYNFGPAARTSAGVSASNFLKLSMKREARER